MNDPADRLADALLECGLCHRQIPSRAMVEHIRECALREHPVEDQFE